MELNPQDISESSYNIYLIQNNTALIRVLQCLYEIFKNQMSYTQTKIIINTLNKNKNSFSLDIINLLEIFDKNNPDQININIFKNVIQIFINMLMMEIERFKVDSNQMIPKWIFYELFSNFNKYIKDNKIPWQNNIFDKLIEPTYLSRDSFPKLYEFIEQFKTNYRSIFVENFYFILLNLTKCTKCDNILDEDSSIKCFLNLDSNAIDNISKLIKKLFAENNHSYNHSHYCIKCGNNTIIKSHKAFWNTPPFLLIEFDGPIKNSKKLEKEISIGEYTLTNIGPKKYELYGFICEEQNKNFIAYLKNEKSWFKYSEINKVEKYEIGSLKKYCPNMAIYKGV